MKRWKFLITRLSILIMEYCDEAGQHEDDIIPCIWDQKQAMIALISFEAVLVTNGKLLIKKTLDILLTWLNEVLDFYTLFCLVVHRSFFKKIKLSQYFPMNSVGFLKYHPREQSFCWRILTSESKPSAKMHSLFGKLVLREYVVDICWFILLNTHFLLLLEATPTLTLCPITHRSTHTCMFL